MVYEVYTKTNTMEWWYTIPLALIAFIVGNSPAIPLYLYLRTTDLKPGSLTKTQQQPSQFQKANKPQNK